MWSRYGKTPLYERKKAPQLPHSKSDPLYIGKIREMTGIGYARFA